MIAEIAIYHQTYLIELNSHNSLQRQYKGFIETAQLSFAETELPYGLFRLNRFPEALPKDFKMPHPIRLGQRMEVFMEVALALEYEVLAKNLQIIHEKRTLGEFDFIIRSKDGGKPIHLEMVYKFYFLRPELGGNWIDQLQGPNGRDHLKLKLEKMQGHQFPLLHEPEAHPYLKELGLNPDELEQNLFFKAQIFVPVNYNDSLGHKPFTDAISGNYFSFQELDNLNRQEFCFYIPFKNDWVAQPESADMFEPFKTFYKKISATLNEQRSVLFWMYSAETQQFKRHFASWW
ncbi:DUF1853 family protein [Leeuwenhoekiella nanhaiensis]|uniref:DUF1853 domain-containing protein n=1 Tax=Leeuwenhoekiella nanhaiensis TaxID=1655491 RepID=A0A2G1VTX1_9FLAO|nr:DUF1853 family protein [Leeuwenhoekiella nanhaiensis]PHQ30233.1 hypothetical protein CJ305_04525 [Leeuwenhoekiella nanhaiensis]